MKAILSIAFLSLLVVCACSDEDAPAIPWKRMNSNTVADLRSVVFTDANTGYTVGHVFGGGETVLLKTTNAGNDWIRLNITPRDYLFAITFPTPMIGYVVCVSGQIFKTTDAGEHWTEQVSGTTNSLYSVCFINPDTGYAVGYKGTVLKTTDGGTKWSYHPLVDSLYSLFSVTFTDPDTGYAAGYVYHDWSTGRILKTTDGGISWNQQVIPDSTEILYTVFFTDARTGYAGGNFYDKIAPPHLSGGIYKTNDGGAHWVRSYQVENSNVVIHGLYFLSPTTGYAVGSVGTILKTTDAGKTWISQPSGPVWGLLSCWFTSESIGYIVGANGVILKTTTGGE